MEAVTPPVEEIVENSLTRADLVETAVVLLIMFAAILLVRRISIRLGERSNAEERTARAIGRALSYVIVACAIMAILWRLDVRIAPLVGAIGIGGLAAAFALREFLENMAAGVTMQLRRPFKLGDEIEVNAIRGVLEEITLRSITVYSLDGDKVYIPNRLVLSDNIINHTARGRRRTTLEVGVAYETDLAAARTTIIKAVRSSEGVRTSPPPEAWVETFSDSSINFAVRFWHAPRTADQWRVRNEVSINIHRAFADSDITIPFPQRVLHMRTIPEN